MGKVPAHDSEFAVVQLGFVAVSSVTEQQVTGEALWVKPLRPTLTRSGRLLGLLALPWALGFLLAAGPLLAVLGISLGPQSPLLLRVIVLAVGLIPAVIWMGHRWLGRAPGFRWLLESPQPFASLDSQGIALTLPGDGTRRLEWDQIAALVPRRWRERARLVGVEGSTLAVIPDGLVHPQTGQGSGRTLAQLIVDERPDRFALSHADWAGRPDAFSTRDAVGHFDVRLAARRRTAVLAGFAVVLIGATLIAATLWFASTAR